MKAIGFRKRLVVGPVRAEAIAVPAVGGVLGTLWARALFASVDISRYSGGFSLLFYVPESTALVGPAADRPEGRVRPGSARRGSR